MANQPMSDDSVPDNFFCPLTLQIMEDPVQDKQTGHIFERRAILEWLRRSRTSTCPMTRQPLHFANLQEHTELREEIQAWTSLQGGLARTVSFCFRKEDKTVEEKAARVDRLMNTRSRILHKRNQQFQAIAGRV